MLSKSVLSAAIAVPIVDAGVSSRDTLVLLQRQADAKIGAVRGDVESSAMSGVGMTAPVSAKGYELVANLKNNDEMTSFIERVVRWEGRVVNDESKLRGLVPYYSGTVEQQSLESLKQELRQAAWVGEGLGRTAPLNEDGYKQVAALKDRHHMMAFSRRILDAHRKKCNDEGSLIGMMPYFNGAVSVQSYEKLRQELLSAPWAVDRLGSRTEANKLSMSATTQNVKLAEAKRDGRTEEFFSRVHSHVVGKDGLNGDPILLMIGEDAYLVDPKAGVKTPSALADEWGLKAHDPQAVAEVAKAKGVNLLLWSSDYKAVDKVLASATVPKSSRIRGWINGVEQDESAVRDMSPSKAVKLGLSVMWLQGGGWDGKESILQSGTSHVAKTLLRGSFLGSIAEDVRTQGHGKSECPCVGIDGNSGEINITIDGDVASYPADVGSRCEAWDDDRHPTACHDGGEPGKGRGFCAQKWCYVDACSCDSGLPMRATYLRKAIYKGRPLYYSYATCGGEDTYSPWKAHHGANESNSSATEENETTGKDQDQEGMSEQEDDGKVESKDSGDHEEGVDRMKQPGKETDSSSGETAAEKTDGDSSETSGDNTEGSSKGDAEGKAKADGSDGSRREDAEGESKTKVHTGTSTDDVDGESKGHTGSNTEKAHGSSTEDGDGESKEGGGKTKADGSNTENGDGESKASTDSKSKGGRHESNTKADNLKSDHQQKAGTSKNGDDDSEERTDEAGEQAGKASKRAKTDADNSRDGGDGSDESQADTGGNKEKDAKDEEDTQVDAKNKKVDKNSAKEEDENANEGMPEAKGDENTARTASSKEDKAKEDKAVPSEGNGEVNTDASDETSVDDGSAPEGTREDETKSASTEEDKDVTTEAKPKANKDSNDDVPKIDADIDVRGDSDTQVEVEMPAEDVDAGLEAMCSSPIDAKLAGKSGCMCVGLTGLPGTVKVTLSENSTAEYPADVGGSCSSWDEDRHPECMKTGDSVPDWCHESWCYVDPCSCNQKAVMAGKTGGYLPKSNFEGKPLYYSYKACGSVDLWTAKNNADACVNKEEKECSGDCLWTGSQCTDQQLISVCDAEQGNSVGFRSVTKVVVAAVVASVAAFV